MVGNHGDFNSNVLYFSSVKRKRKKTKQNEEENRNSSLKYGMKRKLNTDIQLWEYFVKRPRDIFVWKNNGNPWIRWAFFFLFSILFWLISSKSSLRSVNLDRVWCRCEQLHTAARMRNLLFWLFVRLPGVDFENSAVARDGQRYS